MSSYIKPCLLLPPTDPSETFPPFHDTPHCAREKRREIGAGHLQNRERKKKSKSVHVQDQEKIGGYVAFLGKPSVHPLGSNVAGLAGTPRASLFSPICASHTKDGWRFALIFGGTREILCRSEDGGFKCDMHVRVWDGRYMSCRSQVKHLRLSPLRQCGSGGGRFFPEAYVCILRKEAHRAVNVK